MNYEEIKNKIKGPVFSLYVPFKNNGDIDLHSLLKYIHFLIDGGAKCIYLPFYCGRCDLMSNIEIEYVNRFCASEIKKKDKDVLFIGTTPYTYSTDMVIQHCQLLESFGADAIAVIYPIKVFSEEHIIQLFEDISKKTKLGLMIHEQKVVDGIAGGHRNWNIETLKTLSKMDCVVALKEDSKEDNYSEQIIRELKNDISIMISGKGLPQWLQFATDGCQAWLSGIGAVKPKIEIDFYNAYKEGKLNICHEIISKWEDGIKEFIKKTGWHLGIRSLMDSAGVMHRGERRPLISLNDKKQKEADKLWCELKK